MKIPSGPFQGLSAWHSDGTLIDACGQLSPSRVRHGSLSHQGSWRGDACVCLVSGYQIRPSSIFLKCVFTVLRWPVRVGLPLRAGLAVLAKQSIRAPTNASFFPRIQMAYWLRIPMCPHPESGSFRHLSIAAETIPIGEPVWLFPSISELRSWWTYSVANFTHSNLPLYIHSAETVFREWVGHCLADRVSDNSETVASRTNFELQFLFFRHQIGSLWTFVCHSYLFYALTFPVRRNYRLRGTNVPRTLRVQSAA